MDKMVNLKVEITAEDNPETLNEYAKFWFGVGQYGGVEDYVILNHKERTIFIFLGREQNMGRIISHEIVHDVLMREVSETACDMWDDIDNPNRKLT